jgi:outer membrane protein OmpA-like peptidoglycan-associated protein
LRAVIIVLLIFFFHDAFSQNASCPKSNDKKALKFFDEAVELYRHRKYTDAAAAVAESLEKDPEFGEAYLLQGNISLKKKDDKTMIESYQKVIELCPDLEPDVYYELGRLDFYLKNWKKAEVNFKKFLEFDRINEDHGKKAEQMLASAKLYAHPVSFNPVPVKDISTADPEYLPYISPDNELAFFTRRFEMKQKSLLTSQEVEKFMIARLQANGTYDKGNPMPDPFNRGSSNNEGGATITIDNKHLYFTVNVKGNFDIHSSDFVDGKWTEIKNLGPTVNDPKSWDTQPSISADGKTLYFVSDRDSIWGSDIFKSVKDEAGNWTRPVRLPEIINTSGEEKTPFIHTDSRTLYFSSDSLPGLGGYDIFKSQLDSNGRWMKPVNLGYPINTEADEVGFFVSTDGRNGYFASNKISKSSGYDIFSFELYNEARPDKVYFEKGDVNGDDTTEIVQASIEIKDAVTKKITRIDVDSISGEYAFVVNFNHDLLVSLKKEGYVFQSDYISTKDSSNYKPKKQDRELVKLELGGQYAINDILFTSNSYEINDTIKTVLDEFADYLLKNPGLNVSLQGHTDNVGNPHANMMLSENRAKAVYDYLTSRNIESRRISYKGFGETRPIGSNNTEEGRSKNRRTVFVVTSK